VDFAGELATVREYLAGNGYRVAVIGGVALAAYGCPRMTLDLDLVTDAAAQDSLVQFMESRGFVTLHRSSGFSNHRHAERDRGRVDVMYVRDDTADRVFASARALPGPQGHPILVPKPEHLVAMKVRAMQDAPERARQDLVDIAYLLGVEGIDRTEVRGYFERAGLLERWHELARGR
jgi:Nucleotidyl transferase AbiEii toxin, Type IV TA system